VALVRALLPVHNNFAARSATKEQENVRNLIASPQAFICNDCVDVWIEILADDGRSGRNGENR